MSTPYSRSYKRSNSTISQVCDHGFYSRSSVAELPSEAPLLARLRYRQDLRASMVGEQGSDTHAYNSSKRLTMPRRYTRTTGIDNNSPDSLLTKLRRLQDLRASIVEQDQCDTEPCNDASRVATPKNYSRSSEVGEKPPHSLLTKLRHRQEQRASMAERTENTPPPNNVSRPPLIATKSYTCDKNVLYNSNSSLLGRLRHRQEERASKAVEQWETQQYNMDTPYSAAVSSWLYEKSIFNNSPPPVPSHGISDAWFGLPYAQMYISKTGTDGYFTSNIRRAGRVQFPTLEMSGVKISDLLRILGRSADDRHATNLSSVFGGNPVQCYNQQKLLLPQQPKSESLEDPRPRSPYLFSVDSEPPSTAATEASHSQVVSPSPGGAVEQCRIVHISSVAELQPDKPQLVNVDSVGENYTIKPSFA
ncbi:hypothetical protein H4R20_004036 [Coemansia guatemalensis]|uniref:Uncharacterized protein n=1 Tax=Coemansia guatemalensis TaxID=2761395 RepID=A0A9W8HSH7_9FUNG|nr:hypothetical protein H4R20_004036 [Coemansia guatemalensis]